MLSPLWRTVPRLDRGSLTNRMTRYPGHRGLKLIVLCLVWLCARDGRAQEIPEEEANAERAMTLPYPAVGPTHVIPRTAHQELAGGAPATFSLDSRSLIVQTRPDAVNVWAVLVFYWPQIVGGLTGLVVLGACLVLWRISRRGQLAGHPYCPKCGYCLTGCSGGRCPECGLEDALKRAVVGKSRWRRMLPAMVTALLAVAVYGVLLGSGLPREGTISTWVNWWSVSLLKWAQKEGLSEITERSRRIYRLVELDVASGRVVRRLFTLPDHDWMLKTLLPNERAIFIRDDRRSAEVALMDTRRGRVIRTLPRPESDTGGWVLAEGQYAVAGVSSDGLTAYTVWVHEKRPDVRCVAWDLLTGDERLVFVVEVPTGNEAMRRRRVEVVCIPGRGILALQFPLPTFWKGGAEAREVLIRDLGRQGSVVRTMLLPADFTQPVFSADGHTMFMGTYSSDHVSAWDLGTGEQVADILRCPDGWKWRQNPVYDSTRQRLFVTASTGPHLLKSVILVGDPQRREWTHQLTYPESAMARMFHVLKLSPDGRWLAAFCEPKREYRTGPGLGFEIIIWDLSALGPGSQGESDAER